MLRNGANKRKIALELLPIVLLIFLLLLDQITKTCAKNLHDNADWMSTTVISNFFELRYVMNQGAAFSFLAGVEWGQTFFKCLTVVAIVLFFIYYVHICKKGCKWARYALILMFAGMLGNFIDRLYYDGVVDFISLIFGSYHFPIFNFADIYMTVGVIMLILHFFFIDKDAIFRKKKSNA